MQRLLGLVFALSLCSCSVAFQDSVRSSGTYCSTSRLWYVSDFVMSAGLTYLVVSTDADEAAAYVPGALLATSGLIGVWKRGNCVRHRQTASPEQWARDSERESARDAARAERTREMSERMRQPTSAPPPISTSQPSSAPPSSPPQPSIRPQATGTPARSNSQPDGACVCRGYPLGHSRAAEQRPELCAPMTSTDAASCDSSCKTKGYAIGLFRGTSSC
jgi:hypothetical protein